jgi:uncharacterized protein
MTSCTSFQVSTCIASAWASANLIARSWKVKPAITNPAERITIGAGAASGVDGLWFGTLSELITGRIPQVWLATGKEQVIAVVGKRGSGKSFSLGVIAEGLAAASSSRISNQTRPRAAILFDPLDVYWTTRYPVGPSKNAEANRLFGLAKLAGVTDLEFRVAAWVPGGENRQPTDPDWFENLQLPVDAMGLDEWELLLECSVLTDPMGQAFADARDLVRGGYVLQGETIPPVAQYGIPELANSLEAPAIQTTYHRETIRALRQRLRSLAATGLFSAGGTPITSLAVAGQVSVVLLGRIGQSYRGAVVAILTRLLIEHRSRAAFAEKRLVLEPNLSSHQTTELARVVDSEPPRTVVLLDEAQSFLAPGTPGPARDVFIRLVKEGRNIGLSAVLATQQPSALDQRVLSQVETFAAHQLVTEADIRAVRDNLKAALPTEFVFGNRTLDVGQLFRELPPGQCLLSAADIDCTPPRSLVVAVRPRSTVHGGIEL